MSDVFGALDLATNWGSAWGAPGGPLRYGSARIGVAGCSLGAFFTDFHDQFTTLIAIHKPTVICYEAPLLRLGFGSKGRTSIDVAMKLIGLAGHTDFVCHQHGIRCFSVTSSDVAEYFIGKNRWPGKRAEKKARTIEACKALGFDPADDDQADAIALWHFAVWRLAPKSAPKRWHGPLFGAQA